MTRRQAKKHYKKAMRFATFSFELADRYLNRYKVKDSCMKGY